jgi:hypothetical protein
MIPVIVKQNDANYDKPIIEVFNGYLLKGKKCINLLQNSICTLSFNEFYFCS